MLLKVLILLLIFFYIQFFGLVNIPCKIITWLFSSFARTRNLACYSDKVSFRVFVKKISVYKEQHFIRWFKIDNDKNDRLQKLKNYIKEIFFRFAVHKVILFGCKGFKINDCKLLRIGIFFSFFFFCHHGKKNY